MNSFDYIFLFFSINGLFFILSLVSITHIITGSSIFGPIRKIIMNNSDFLSKMIMCNQCTGFWIGILGSLILIPFWHQKIDQFNIINYLFFSFLMVGPIISLASDLMYRLKQFLCKEC